MTENDAPYAVVKFQHEYNAEGQAVVELVPMIWVDNSIDGEVFCCYPPQRDYRHLQTWLKELKPTGKTWVKYPVEIITRADSYEQGIRRLERSCVQSTVETTTDAEIEKNQKIKEPATVVESFDSARQILQSIADNHQTRARSYSSCSSDVSPKAKKYKKGDNVRTRTIRHDINKSPVLLLSDAPDQFSERPQVHASRTLSFSGCNSDKASSSNTHKLIEHEQDVSNEVTDKKSDQLETIIEEKIEDDLDFMTAGQMVQFFCQAVEASEKRLQTFIKNRIKRSQSSIVFDLKKRITELKNSMTLNYGLSNLDKYSELDENKLGISLPAGTLEEYLKLDTMITDETHEEFFNGFILTKATNAENYKKGIASVIGALMAKTVQLQYSGQGKQTKKSSKHNFSGTSLYKKMQGIIGSVFAKDNVKQSDILKYTGVWFAGANDREKGRRNRETKDSRDGDSE